MKKFLSSIVFAFLAVTSLGAFAQSKSIEFGAFGQSTSVKSSPVAGFSANGNTGLDVKVIFADVPNTAKNVDLILGVSSQSADLKLAGTALGKVNSETALAGLRYRFTSGEYFQPYVGAGIHYTWMDGKLAANTAHLSQNKNGLGEMVELGIQVPVKTSFIDNVSFGVQHYFNPKQVMETNAGALISDLKLNSTHYSISVGKKF